MDLSRRYSKLPLTDLVKVVEMQHAYTPAAVEAARAEIRHRSPSSSSLLQAAREVVNAQIDHYLDGFSVLSGTLELPTSHYLNEEEVRMLFRTRFIARKSEFDDMIPEAWKYAIGGF